MVMTTQLLENTKETHNMNRIYKELVTQRILKHIDQHTLNKIHDINYTEH